MQCLMASANIWEQYIEGNRGDANYIDSNPTRKYNMLKNLPDSIEANFQC